MTCCHGDLVPMHHLYDFTDTSISMATKSEINSTHYIYSLYIVAFELYIRELNFFHPTPECRNFFSSGSLNAEGLQQYYFYFYSYAVKRLFFIFTFSVFQSR